MLITRGLKVELLLIPLPRVSYTFNHICTLVKVYHFACLLSEGIRGFELVGLCGHVLLAQVLLVSHLDIPRVPAGRGHRTVLLPSWVYISGVGESGA